MYEPDDQRLVDNDTLSDLNINLNKMDQASNNIAVTESAVNLTENEDERWLQLSNLRFGLKFISGAANEIQTELNVASDFYNPAFMMLSHDHRNT